MHELTVTYHQNITVLPEAFTAVNTGSQESPGKINGCFFQGLDYYPFGSLMPGRKMNASDYRFGYQGQEKDDEISGVTGSHLSFKYRIYDSRTGRFYSVDLLTKSYPMLTPYQFASNCPISGVDLDGLEYYYAANGKFIGVGDPKNTTRKLVLTKKNQRQIKRQMRKNGEVTLSSPTDIITVPNSEVLDKADQAFNETESTNHEHSFVVGEKDGTQVTSSLVEGDENSVEIRGFSELTEEGASTSFSVHTHPDDLTREGNDYTAGSPNPSSGKNEDLSNRKRREKSGKVKEPSWILGYEIKKEPIYETQLDQTEKVTGYDLYPKRVVTFYTGTEKDKYPRLDWDDFKKTSQEINKKPLPTTE
jgi:RHS repeat-associated protein